MLRLIIGTPRRKTQPIDHDGKDHNASENSANEVSSNPPTDDLQHLITRPHEELLEPWPDFIKQATEVVELQAVRLNIQEWTKTYLQRKWRWAARIANQEHTRWSQLAARWDPQIYDKRPATRAQAPPRTRSDDDINTFLQTLTQQNDHQPHWLNMARDTTQWTKLENEFIQYALNPPKPNNQLTPSTTPQT